MSHIKRRLKYFGFTRCQYKNGELVLRLTKGVIRSYKDDSKGYAQLIVEDLAEYMPQKENIWLKLGKALNVKVKSKSKSYKFFTRNFF